MKIINVILDLSLVVASIWMVFIVRGLGGLFGKTLNTITFGAVVLDIAHITETTLDFFVPTMNADLSEFIHRVMVFTGFAMHVLGKYVD